MPLDTAKIKALREERGLTQQAAAELAGLVSAQRWSNIENGRDANMKIATLEKVARALGVKAAELLK